jgi:hypothetical protein
VFCRCNDASDPRNEIGIPVRGISSVATSAVGVLSPASADSVSRSLRRASGLYFAGCEAVVGPAAGSASDGSGICWLIAGTAVCVGGEEG